MLPSREAGRTAAILGNILNDEDIIGLACGKKEHEQGQLRRHTIVLNVFAFNRIYNSLAIFRGLTVRIRKRNFAHALPTIVIA